LYHSIPMYSLQEARRAALVNRLQMEADRATRRRRRRREIRALKAFYGANYRLYHRRLGGNEDEDDDDDGSFGDGSGTATDEEEENEEEARYLDMLEERHNNMRVWHASGLELRFMRRDASLGSCCPLCWQLI
jgi:hypothetical protein